MKETVLFRDGRHLTTASAQQDGSLCITSGGTAGEFVISVPMTELGRLYRAIGPDNPGVLADYPAASVLVRHIGIRFQSGSSDPFGKIRNFLSERLINYSESYWPTR